MPPAKQLSLLRPFLAGALVPAVLAGALWQRSLLEKAGGETVVPRVPPPQQPERIVPHDQRQWVLGLDGWTITVDGTDLALLPSNALRRPAEADRVDLGLSPYDRWIVSYSRSAGLDWELVAAIIAEESAFDAGAESERGAVGLMQVRPVAAAQVGEEHFADPESNIRTGVQYLVYLNELFSDVPEAERLPFVLAAYNMGPAHVRDARELARRLGFDPHRWQGNVARVLPLLEEETFYRTLPAGYAQGRRVADYVARVLDRYEAFIRTGSG